MRLPLPVILCIVCSLVLGGCAYRPLVNQLPEYGRNERSWEEIQADSIYQDDLKFARRMDSLYNGVAYFIRDGFRDLGPRAWVYATKEFNRAWLLDSLNPHIYMGFAMTEMSRGDLTSAVKYYAKYRELYEKNPVPRFPAITKTDSVAFVPDSMNIVASDSVIAATPDSAVAEKRESLVYGKLVSMKRDYWEFGEWAGVCISSANSELKDRLLNSEILPENERFILYLDYVSRYGLGRYVEAEIRVFQIYDKASGKWVPAPKDSVYRFSYVERKGLILNEERERLVKIGMPSIPDSSARVFLLKPNVFQSDTLVPYGYSKMFTENELSKKNPNSLKLEPYQERTYIEPSPIKTPVRSSIARALFEGKYDSLRTYLDLARELENHYGYMPLTDEEYARISLLGSDFLSDSTTFHKERKLRHRLARSSVDDTLELLIAYRSYPYVFTDEFLDKVNPSSGMAHLVNLAQSPFYSSARKIPDNLIGYRVHFGPRMNIYEGAIQDVIGPASVGGEMDVEGCLLYGCLSAGISIYGPVSGKEIITYDGEVYDRIQSGDASFLASFGIRPFVHRHGDLELYGIANLAEYAAKDTAFKSLASVDFGVGAAITYLFFGSEKGMKDSFVMDVRIKAEYFWNDSPEMFEEKLGHTLVFGLQFGFGKTSYTFVEEKNRKHEFSIQEKMGRFWME